MSEESSEQVKRLYRSRRDRVLGGVCGGVAEYLEVDPIVVRLLWGFSVLLFGFGFLLYIIALFVIPNNPDQVVEQEGKPDAGRGERGQDRSLAIGIVLLFMGGLLLLRQFDFFDFHFFQFNFFPWRLFWPLALIGVGIFFIASGAKVGSAFEGARQKLAASRLRKSRSEKMLFGVCAGIGHAYRLDPTIVRVLWVIATLLSGGFLFLLYIVLAVVMPFEDEATRNSDAEAEDSRNNAKGSA